MISKHKNAKSDINRSHHQEPHSIADNFQDGTFAPSYVTSHKPSRLQKYRTRTAIIRRSSMRSERVHDNPAINQMNANLIPFSAFEFSSAYKTYRKITNRITHNPKPYKQSPHPQAGTVIELAKHSPITHHIRATQHRYPSTIIGDTLLKQQAILTINNIPALIDRLKQDLTDIQRARTGNIIATPKKTEKKDDREQTSDANFFDAAADADDTVDTDEASEHETETQSSIDLLAKQMRDAENVLLHFDARITRKIGARELAELKQMGVVEEISQ